MIFILEFANGVVVLVDVSCAGRLYTFSCYECVRLGDDSAKLIKKRISILFIIVCTRDRVPVGGRACVFRFLIVEYSSSEKY